MRTDRPYLGAVALSGILNTAISALATALLLPSLIASIGLATYGAWALLGLFQALGSVLELGMTKAIVYFVPRMPSLRWSILRRTAGYCAATTLAFAIVALLLVECSSLLLGAAGSRDPALARWILTGGTVIAAACVFTTLCRAFLEAHGRAHLVNFGFALLTVLQYSVALAVAQFSTDPRALICGSVAVYVAVLVIHAIALIRLPAAAAPVAPPVTTAKLPLFRFGARAFATELPLIATTPLCLYLFARTVPSAQDYGVFDLAVRLSALAASVLGFVGVPFFAGGARAAAGTLDQQRLFRAKVETISRVLFVLAVFGCSVFALGGRYLLAPFFGERLDDIYRTTAFLLPGVAFLAALEPISRMQMGLGRLRQLTLARLLLPAATATSLAVLIATSPLIRFSLSLTAGFAAASIATLAIERFENWGRAA